MLILDCFHQPNSSDFSRFKSFGLLLLCILTGFTGETVAAVNRSCFFNGTLQRHPLKTQFTKNPFTATQDNIKCNIHMAFSDETQRTFLVKQSAEIDRPIEFIQYEYVDDWSIVGRDSLVYNDLDSLIAAYSFEWNSIYSHWGKSQKVEYEFNAKQQNSVISYFEWAGDIGEWMATNKDLISYNEAGLRTEIVTQFPKGTARTWTDSIKYSTFFNAKGLETVNSISLLTISKWTEVVKTIFEYGAFDSLIRSTSQEKNPTTQLWEGGAQISISRDSKAQATSYVSTEWNSVAQAFVNSFKILIAPPDAKGVNIWTGQSWDGSKWVNTLRSLTDYHSSGEVNSYTEEQWSDKTSSWESSSQTAYVRNSSGFPLQSLQSRFNPGTQKLEPVYKVEGRQRSMGSAIRELNRNQFLTFNRRKEINVTRGAGFFWNQQKKRGNLLGQEIGAVRP